MKYPVVIHKDEGSAYGIGIPDLPGCYTAGDTLEEALANVQEAAMVHLNGEENIPPPGDIEQYMENPDYAGGVWALVDIDTSALGKSRRINITLPAGAVQDIDHRAKQLGMSRSAFIALMARESMQ